MLDSEIGHDQRRRPGIKARHPGRIWRLEPRWHARGLSSRATQVLRNGWLDAHAPPDPMFFGGAPTLGIGLEEIISPMRPGGNWPAELRQLCPLLARCAAPRLFPQASCPGSLAASSAPGCGVA